MINNNYNYYYNQVQCSLSKHEMPLRFEVIKTYIDGKKYKRYREKADLEFNEYKQHLVPSTKPQRKFKFTYYFS